MKSSTTITLYTDPSFQQKQEIEQENFCAMANFEWSDVVKRPEQNDDELNGYIKKSKEYFSLTKTKFTLFSGKGMMSTDGLNNLRTSLNEIDKHLVVVNMGNLGYGLYLSPEAKDPIPEGTPIVIYASEILRIPFIKKNDDYCDYGLGSTLMGPFNNGYAVSAFKVGNKARLIQHAYPPKNIYSDYGDIPEQILEKIATANAHVEEYMSQDGLIYPVLISNQEIKPGKIILFNYGEIYWNRKKISPEIFNHFGEPFLSSGDPHEHYVNNIFFYFCKKSIKNLGLDHMQFIKDLFDKLKKAFNESNGDYKVAASQFVDILNSSNFSLEKIFDESKVTKLLSNKITRRNLEGDLKKFVSEAKEDHKDAIKQVKEYLDKTTGEYLNQIEPLMLTTKFGK